MKFRITTLGENTAGRTDVLAEWGLSMLLEYGGTTILFDTGASGAIIHNAEYLGVDLEKIDKIVLSHGHFDHTGGLRAVLQKLKRKVEVIAHPDMLAAKYSRRSGQPDRYIGLPFRLEELRSLGAEFTFSQTPQRVSDRITTSGEIPLVTDFEAVEPSLCVKQGEELIQDPLLDDLALFVTTAQGLVVILGCAHRGMINTVRQARSLTGVDKVHMVIGGAHLKDSTDEQIWQNISALNEIGVKKLSLSHCTGMPATMLLAQTFSDDFVFNQTGTVIDLPSLPESVKPNRQG